MTNYRAVIIKRIYFLRRHLERAKDPSTVNSLELRISECEILLQSNEVGGS